MALPSSSNDTSDAESQALPIPSATTREAVNVPGSQYVLPADQQEANRYILSSLELRPFDCELINKFRLNSQHILLKKAFGNKILHIPLEGQPAYFVLDSGTGTGTTPIPYDGSGCRVLTSVLHRHMAIRSGLPILAFGDSPWNRHRGTPLPAKQTHKCLLFAYRRHQPSH